MDLNEFLTELRKLKSKYKWRMAGLAIRASSDRRTRHHPEDLCPITAMYADRTNQRDYVGIHRFQACGFELGLAEEDIARVALAADDADEPGTNIDIVRRALLEALDLKEVAT